jgi:hypothetical protein
MLTDKRQCSGSVGFSIESKSWDPYPDLTDPNPSYNDYSQTVFLMAYITDLVILKNLLSNLINSTVDKREKICLHKTSLVRIIILVPVPYYGSAFKAEES